MNWDLMPKEPMQSNVHNRGSRNIVGEEVAFAGLNRNEQVDGKGRRINDIGNEIDYEGLQNDLISPMRR